MWVLVPRSKPLEWVIVKMHGSNQDNLDWVTVQSPNWCSQRTSSPTSLSFWHFSQQSKWKIPSCGSRTVKNVKPFFWFLYFLFLYFFYVFVHLHLKTTHQKSDQKFIWVHPVCFQSLFFRSDSQKFRVRASVVPYRKSYCRHQLFKFIYFFVKEREYQCETFSWCEILACWKTVWVMMSVCWYVDSHNEWQWRSGVMLSGGQKSPQKPPGIQLSAQPGNLMS